MECGPSQEVKSLRGDFCPIQSLATSLEAHPRLGTWRIESLGGADPMSWHKWGHRDQQVAQGLKVEKLEASSAQ